MRLKLKENYLLGESANVSVIHRRVGYVDSGERSVLREHLARLRGQIVGGRGDRLVQVAHPAGVLVALRLLFRRVQPENVYGLEVARRAQEQRVGRERERRDGRVALQASAELEQTLALRHREHAYHGALLRGRGQLRAVPVEGQSGQWTIMRRYHRDRSLFNFIQKKK